MNFMERLVLSLFGEYVNPEAIGIMAALLILYFLGLIFAAVSYVLSSLGLHTIAKRRGIRNPWLAWIPVANTWVMGSISDNYQHVAKGKKRYRRRVLLGINIAISAFPVIMLISEVVILLVDRAASSPLSALPFVSFFVIWLCMMAFMVLLAVFTYMALYDLYDSCNPDNAVVFLLLSIFISFTQPFFIFSCRKKDEGMFRRKQPYELYQAAPYAANYVAQTESASYSGESAAIPAESAEGIKRE